MNKCSTCLKKIFFAVFRVCFAESRCRVFYHPQRTDGGLLRLCSGEDHSICKCAEGKPNHNHCGKKLWNMFIGPFQAHQKHSMVTNDHYLPLFFTIKYTLFCWFVFPENCSMQKKLGLEDNKRSDKACEVTKDRSVDYGKKGKERMSE